MNWRRSNLTGQRHLFDESDPFDDTSACGRTSVTVSAPCIPEKDDSRCPACYRMYMATRPQRQEDLYRTGMR